MKNNQELSGGPRIRIAHVCPFVGEQFGGSEHFVTKITKQQALDHEVSIFTTTRFPSRRGSRKVAGATIDRTYTPAVIWNIDPIGFLVPKIIHSSADIVHIHSYLYTISAQSILANLIRKKKVLLQLHGGLGPPPYRTTFAKRAIKRLYDNSIGSFIIKNSDVVASVSHQDLQYIASKYPSESKKLVHVPNCIDTKEFRFSDRRYNREKPVLLYVGDLEAWKGLNLIYRWLLKETRFPKHQFTFRFVGTGSLFSRIEHLSRLIDKKRNGIRIELLGQKTHEEIPSIMADSDALVFPSYWEGMPTVVLEAMATGLPVISTPVGDLPSILINGENSLLIDRSIQSLDLALAHVFSRDSILKELAYRARKVVDGQFNLDSVDTRLDTIYSEMV